MPEIGVIVRWICMPWHEKPLAAPVLAEQIQSLPEGRYPVVRVVHENDRDIVIAVNAIGDIERIGHSCADNEGSG